MTKTRSRLTTSLVPVAHVRTGATTALVPVARVMVNAWGVVTRFADASIAKPVKQAKGRQRQRISDSKIAAILAPYGKHWNPAKAA
jgi:hypothetical protein